MLFIITFGVIQRSMNITEGFLVPNVEHPYNWYMGDTHNINVYSGTQDDDEHEFNPSGNYVKDVGSSDYVDCRNSGFTKEFCLKTPITNGSPSSCMCDNGQLGQRLPGFKGKCVCNTDSYQANYI